MASTPIEFRTYSGQTLTAKLVAAGDTLVTTFSGGTAPTELTFGKGRYRVTETGATTGHHTLHIYSGTDLLGISDYDLEDTTSVQFPVEIKDALAGGVAASITTEEINLVSS